MTEQPPSDIPTQKEQEWLEEPTKPNPEDFKNPENYEFAQEQYKEKLSVYTARVQWKKEQKALEESKGIKYPDYNYFVPLDDYGRPEQPFRPGMVAQWLHENDHFKTDRETDILYFGDVKTGKWTEKGETTLKEILAKILGIENRESHFRNILHDLKSLSYTNISFSRKIACENCLLDVETQTTTSFNIDEMAFHEIPVKYDPTAKCPNWEAFIKEVVNPDDLPTIQEWSGFLLLPDYRFHKLLWIYGEGRNGKGRWVITMEAILGEKNVSGIGLEEFDGNHRFALKQLYGKLFNPCSEPTTNRALQTSLLKKATGQDTIEAEIKGKQGRLSFRNYAKITVLANRFPKVNDQTTAFKERRLFIKFPNEFTGKDQIQNIEANWLTVNDERSGILNWMLEGLKRLLENGCFTESKTQQETEIEFQRHSDTISAFLNELGIFDKNLVTTRSEAFDSYKNYCDVLGLEAENEKKFTARLKETPKISLTTISKPKRERAWKGISFKQIDDDGHVTNVTDVTGKGVFYPLNISSFQKREESSTRVTTVTSVTEEREGINYSQLSCVFCRKGIMDNDWVQDDFTWDKPAHRRCYDEKKSQLANQSDKEFS
jgi:P4 family phage/plasmid primase-like protien